MNSKKLYFVTMAFIMIFTFLLGSFAPYFAIGTVAETVSSEVPLVTLQSVWKYLDDGSDPGSSSERTKWTNIDFNDSGWKTSSGNATFGAKSGKLQALDTNGVFLPKILLNHYMSDGKCVPTYFFRTSFNLDSAPQAGLALVGSIYYDDAAIIYVNGTCVAEFDVPDGGFESNLSYGGSGAYDPKLGEFVADASLLKAGKNVISVEVHNQRNDSSDIYFEMTRLAIDVGKPEYLTMNVGEDETMRNFTWYFNSTVGAIQFAKRNGASFPNDFKTVNSVATAHNGTYIHRATITGLEPNTEYVYRVLCGGVISENYYFETDPEDGYNFIFVGDPQLGGSWGSKDDTANWISAVNKAEAMFPNTSFLISAGDQVETYNNEAQYAAFLSPSNLTSLAIATTIGNHDTKGVQYSQHFNNPNTTIDGVAYGSTEAGEDYWYTYNNTLFMHLNINNNSVAEHKTFMEKVINLNPDTQWRIVVMHFAMYGAGPYYTYDSMTEIRTAIAPVFDDLDIDVVLSGHEHIYARSYMMNCTENGIIPDSTNGVQSSVTNPKGVLYLTGSSSSGSKFYNMLNDAQTPHIAVKAQNIVTFSNVEVDEDSFKITTYRAEDGSVLDSFEIIKNENRYPKDSATKIKDNLSTGKKYTTSLLYRQGGKDANWKYDENASITYPDTNGRELTDGYIPTDDNYKNAAWFGLHYETPDALKDGYVYANVDLEEIHKIEKISVYLPDSDFNKENGVFGPLATNVSFFADGHKIDGDVTITPINDYVSAYSITTNLEARYIEVRIDHDGWVFISEFAVDGVEISEDNDTPGNSTSTEDESSKDDNFNSSEDDSTDTSVPDEENDKEPENPPVHEPSINKGDINNNGAIDSMDYVLLKRAYFGTYKLKDIRVGDINSNNEIDSMDYVYLRRAYFGTYAIK